MHKAKIFSTSTTSFIEIDICWTMNGNAIIFVLSCHHIETEAMPKLSKLQISKSSCHQYRSKLFDIGAKRKRNIAQKFVFHALYAQS